MKFLKWPEPWGGYEDFDDTGLKNAFAGTASSVIITGQEHYKQLQ